MGDNNEVNPNNSKPKNQSKNPIVWIVVVFPLYMFIGFIVIPFVLRGQAVDFIKEEFKRDTQIEIVSFNVFAFTLSIEGFLLNENDRELRREV